LIFVDADACPVKEEIIRVADRYGETVTLVADGGLRPSRDNHVIIKIVPQGADAADDWIAENATRDDWVITADIPLAKRCLEKGAGALRPDGRQFTYENIGQAMAGRALSQHIRESTQSQTRNAAFTKADRSTFLQSLDRALNETVKLKQMKDLT